MTQRTGAGARRLAGVPLSRWLSTGVCVAVLTQCWAARANDPASAGSPEASLSEPAASAPVQPSSPGEAQAGQVTSAPVDTPSSEPVAQGGTDAGSGQTGQTYRLEVDAPRDLRTLLLAYLDLARFEGAAQTDRITAAELRRLANAAPVQAKSLLETEGYFNADVRVAGGTGPDGVPVIRLSVTPGPRTQVTALELLPGGVLKERIEAGDKDAMALMSSLTEHWSLPPGEPFRQAAWNAAKNGALAQLRSDGYPTATWGKTEARVDARAHTVSLSGVIESGPIFLLGDLQIEGLKRYDEEAIRNVSPLHRGTPYSEKRLLEFQDRLLKLGLFETVSVDIDPDSEQAGAVPVRVRVREQTYQQATTGVGYSDKTGLRGTLEHRHRRPFGWNGQIYNKLEVGKLARSWEGELISDPDERGYRNLLATSLSWLDAADEITKASRIRVGRSLDTQHIERLAFFEYLDSSLRKANGVTETTHAVSGNYHWVWRDLDNVILPTRGTSASVQAGLGYATSNFAESGPFARLYTRNTLYWPLGGDWFSQWRIEAGQVIAANRVGIPDPLLFRAGGDESVRGYAYRTLGPIKGGLVASGRVVLTTSAEVARPITPRIPSLWWAMFVDAGNSAETWREIKPALGYGLGLRYRSPVGPLRIDLAYGQDVRKVRLHLSVGIAY